jgi:RNA polymerase sigma-70 factor (ECF subfamily)
MRAQRRENWEITLEREQRVRLAIDAFQRGIDPEGNFEFLVEQFYGAVLGYLARWEISQDDRLDITQEVFLGVYKGLKAFRGEAQFSTWLFRIAHNACMRWLGRGGPDRQASSSPADEFEDEELLDRAAELLGDQLDDLIAREKSDRLRKAIAELPTQMRRCVELHVYQDLRYEEVAAVLRLKVGTVKAQLYQARERLRERLGGALTDEDAQEG